MRQVLVTRQKSQSAELVRLLEKEGFQVFSLPLIETVPTGAPIPDKDYDVAVFTSPVSVETFAQHFGRVKFRYTVAVGTKTAKKLQEYGITPDGVPDEFSAEGLIRMFSEIEVKGMKVLSPGAEKRAGDLCGYLEERGAEVDKISTYKTSPVIYEKGYIDRYIKENGIDIITLTAPSAAESLLAQTENLNEVTLVSIGKTTWQYLRERGHESVYPQVQTIEGMTELTANLYKGV